MNIPNKQFNKLINLSCQIQNIDIPSVYYVKYEGKDFTLYDKDMWFISSDDRDVPFEIIKMHYVLKENVFYINVDIFKDPLIAKTLAFRETRRAYQYKEIDKMNKGDKTQEEQHILESWSFGLQLKDAKDNNPNSPIEIDRKAYSYVMMKEYYNMILKYKVLDQEILEMRINRIYSQYKKRL